MSPKSDVPTSPSANCQDQVLNDDVRACSTPVTHASTSDAAVLSSPQSEHSSESGDHEEDRDFPATPPESCDGDDFGENHVDEHENRPTGDNYSLAARSPTNEGADKANAVETKPTSSSHVILSKSLSNHGMTSSHSCDRSITAVCSNDTMLQKTTDALATKSEPPALDANDQSGSFDVLQNLLGRTLNEPNEANVRDRSSQQAKDESGSCESSDDSSSSSLPNNISTVYGENMMSTGVGGIAAIAHGSAVDFRNICLKNQRRLEMQLERLRARTAETQLTTKVWLAQRVSPSFSGLRAVPDSSANESVIAASARIVHSRVGSFLQRRKRTRTGRTVRHAARVLGRELHTHEKDMDVEATDSSSCPSSESELEDEVQPADSGKGKGKSTARIGTENRRECMQVRQKRRKIQRDWDGYRGEVGWRWRWLDVRLNSIDQQIKEHESLRTQLRHEKLPLLDADTEGGCARARGFDDETRNHRTLVRKHINPSLQAHNTFRTVSAPLVHCDRIAICARAAMRDRGFHLVLSLPSDAPESVLNAAREHRRKLRAQMSQQLKASKAQAVAEHQRSTQKTHKKDTLAIRPASGVSKEVSGATKTTNPITGKQMNVIPHAGGNSGTKQTHVDVTSSANRPQGTSDVQYTVNLIAGVDDANDTVMIRTTSEGGPQQDTKDRRESIEKQRCSKSTKVCGGNDTCDSSSRPIVCDPCDNVLLLKASRRRQEQSAMNDIEIPQIVTSSKFEPVYVKEILTPGWRPTCDIMDMKIDGDSKVSTEADALRIDTSEDLSDHVFRIRHSVCERSERTRILGLKCIPQDTHPPPTMVVENRRSSVQMHSTYERRVFPLDVAGDMLPLRVSISETVDEIMSSCPLGNGSN